MFGSEILSGHALYGFERKVSRGVCGFACWFS